MHFTVSMKFILFQWDWKFILVKALEQTDDYFLNKQQT